MPELSSWMLIADLMVFIILIRLVGGWWLNVEAIAGTLFANVFAGNVNTLLMCCINPKVCAVKKFQGIT